MSALSQPPVGDAKPPVIHTRSAHNVRFWTKEAIASGRLRNCSHLKIEEVIEKEIESGKVIEDEANSYFVPGCARHSFEFPFGEVSDDAQLLILRNNLGSNPLSCPKNCTYYENRKWGFLKVATRFAFGGLYGFLRDLVKGFAGLAWQTQVAFIGLVILIMSPKWVPLINSLVRAIWGRFS